MNMLFWVAAFIGLAFLSRAASAVSAAPKFTTDDSEASSADTSYSSADVDDGPSFNIDGTPMMGMLDVHGRVYGDISSTDDLVIHAVDDTWTHDSLWDSSSSSMFDDTFSSSHSWD